MNEFKAFVSELNRGQRKFCSRVCYGLSKVGNPLSRRLKSYIKWRKNVLDRDHNTCQICGDLGNIAHHLESYSFVPGKRYDISNGLTLDTCCHVNWHKSAQTGFWEPRLLRGFRGFMLSDQEGEFFEGVMKKYEDLMA
jgi:hypothetical protein